jgi:hypothetical protein
MQAFFEGPLRFTPTEEADGRRYRVTGAASNRAQFDTAMSRHAKSRTTPR